MMVAAQSLAALSVAPAVARPARRTATPVRRPPLTGDIAHGPVPMASVITVVTGPLPVLAIGCPAAGAPPRPASQEPFHDGV
ncbi:hypothetical protein AB0F03_30820 [Streptomyces sp. NPDC028722]|uniref:hypothetical protein n=1 Tax=unclassified Streptomyces TaxID=2593676 RepID=UPI0033CD9073